MYHGKKKTAESNKERMPSALEIEKNIREMVEVIICFCTHEQKAHNFFRVEKKLRDYVSNLGCLFLQLMLLHDYRRFIKSDTINKIFLDFS